MSEQKDESVTKNRWLQYLLAQLSEVLIMSENYIEAPDCYMPLRFNQAAVGPTWTVMIQILKGGKKEESFLK